MSFGIGAFPFGIFATAFNINDGRPPPGRPISLKDLRIPGWVVLILSAYTLFGW